VSRTFQELFKKKFTPLEIMPRCSLRARGSPSRRPSGPGSAPEGLMPRREALQAGGSPSQAPPRMGSCPGGRPSLRARGSSEPEAAAGLDFRIIPGSAP